MSLVATLLINADLYHFILKSGYIIQREFTWQKW